MRRIQVIAIGPHPAGLDAAAHAVGPRAVAAPDARAQAVERVVGHGDGLFLVLEGGHRRDRPEDFLLEDAHAVLAQQHGRLDIETLVQPARQHVVTRAAGQALRALLAADIDIGQDLVHLHLRDLCAHHGAGIERMAGLDGLHPRDGLLDEALVDRLLDQDARRAGADLALVEREHGQALERLVQELVVVVHHVVEEDVGALAAQLHRGGDQVVGRRVQDVLAHRRRPGEGDFGDALAGGQRLAGLLAIAVDHVEHARRQQVADQFGQHQDRGRRLFGRLEHHHAARRQRRRQLPSHHQQREVPGNDLPHHADGFVEVVGHGVGVDLRDGALLRPDAAREIAEMVDRQRQVGRGGLAQRLAVVDRLGHRQHGQLSLDAVGDAQQDVGPLGGRGARPRGARAMRRVQRQFDVGRARARHAAKRLAGNGRQIVEVLPACRSHPLAADVVLVLFLERVGHIQAQFFQVG
ncbi:Uncharacterised protein [Bordetella pertussis]|nr:Uncharacterised protein [Bordetella pertussis]